MEKVIQNEKVYLPDYEGGSIVNVPSSILKVFGINPPSSPLTENILPLKRYKNCSKVILFIFDSLGYNRIKELGSLNEFKVSPLTSVFPSTTTAALTSFYTAVSPSIHGMVGFRLFLKEFGLIANMIKLSPVGFVERDKLKETGFNPKRFLPVKTIFEMLGRRGIKSFAFTRMHYYKSGLSSLMLKGAEILPYVNIVDLFINVRKVIIGTKGNVFITAYVDDFDTLAHYYGTKTEEEKTTIHVFFNIMKDIFLREGWDKTLILLTGDHGQVPSPHTSKVDIRKHRWLLRNLIMPPTGEFRASYLYLKDGSKERLLKELSKRFSRKFIILTRDEAIELGVFGSKTMGLKNKERLGDVILISKGEHYLFYPYSKFELKARHGGLSKNEMLVPLLVLQ